MPNSFRLTALALFLALPFLLASLAHAASVTGRVVGIADGDTLTLLTASKQQVKVRLAEIDAPEKAQDFGQKSKQSLSELVYGKDVAVEQEDLDRYGRTVGRVRADGVDVNAEQVKRGMAWVYRQYVKDHTLFTLEQKARAAHRGLWAMTNPLPPWEFRHAKRSGSTAYAAAPAPDRSTVLALMGSGVQCGTKRYCNQMSACEEAKAYLVQCGLSKLDRDGDGVPCESLCSQR
jgi:endonuclease YncB( thermonuclease family)